MTEFQAVFRIRIRILRIHIVLWPPGSGSISQTQRYESGSGYFYHQAEIVKKP
jgi:hypothetical protein